MHGHDHDTEGADSLRPKSARIDEESRLTAKAAAEGRWDAVDPAGMARLQRSVGNAGLAASVQTAEQDTEQERSPVHDVISGSGRPLEPEVREDMESRLGHDFSDVRVHDDGRAHESAKAVNAHAYTVGSNVVFQRDRYDPSSTEGRTTLAHELTHVVQQKAGPVDGSPAAGGIRVSDPGDRFEREASATAERAMADPAPIAATAAPVVSTSDTAPVQRQAEEEEQEQEPVQGLFVQREDAEEEAEEATEG
jgi:hypothetical protein